MRGCMLGHCDVFVCLGMGIVVSGAQDSISMGFPVNAYSTEYTVLAHFIVGRLGQGTQKWSLEWKLANQFSAIANKQKPIRSLLHLLRQTSLKPRPVLVTVMQQSRRPVFNT